MKNPLVIIGIVLGASGLIFLLVAVMTKTEKKEVARNYPHAGKKTDNATELIGDVTTIIDNINRKKKEKEAAAEVSKAVDMLGYMPV